MDGVRFDSRRGDEIDLWTVFERHEDPAASPVLSDTAFRTWAAVTAELAQAFAVHNLAWVRGDPVRPALGDGSCPRAGATTRRDRPVVPAVLDQLSVSTDGDNAQENRLSSATGPCLYIRGLTQQVVDEWLSTTTCGELGASPTTAVSATVSESTDPGRQSAT